MRRNMEQLLSNAAREQQFCSASPVCLEGCVHAADFHCSGTAVHVQTGVGLESLTLDLCNKAALSHKSPLSAKMCERFF